MEAKHKRSSVNQEYLKRWQIYKSEKIQKQGKGTVKPWRYTICGGEKKPSIQQVQSEDVPVSESVAENVTKDSPAQQKASSNKRLRFSTSSFKDTKPDGESKAKKRHSLAARRHSYHYRYVASRTDSNFAKMKEEARKKRKSMAPAPNACEYTLQPHSSTAVNYGTPNTVRVPSLVKKARKRCLTEQNGRTPVQEMSKASEKRKPDPALSEKRKHLYKSKDTISSLAKKRKSILVSVKSETPKAAPTKDTEQQQSIAQLKSVIDECTILLESGCPTSQILPWLEEIQQKIPLSFQSADFWVLKARVHLQLKDVDQLFEVFGNAMKYKAKPASVITDTLPNMIKDLVSANKKEEAAAWLLHSAAATTPPPYSGNIPYTPSQTPFNMGSTRRLDNIVYADTPMPGTTPRGHRLRSNADTPLLDTTPQGLRLRSSNSVNIKYLVQKSTPFKQRASTHEEESLLITPVRRTIRKSVTSARKLQLDVIIDSLDDLTVNEKKNALYRDNPAILSD